MEKLKKKARPHVFKSLIVTKSTIEFLRFEGEFESKLIMDLVISRINRTTLKLSGFAEPLKVKCAQMKVGATRHEWESFFRDNPKMNEMKPGYRPDTIHVQNLPLKWFGGSRPKTNYLIDVFKTFGDIKRFHVPLLDQLEIEDRTGFKKFNHQDTLTFEAFIMYKDYIGFVKAMDGFRGMKLVKQLRECNKLLEYDIQVDFDKTKHLSDKSIKKRKLDKEYGIKNSQEMKKLKEETKKQRELYELRIKQLTKRKDQAKVLLKTILTKVAEKEDEKRNAEEQHKQKIQEEKRKRMEEKKRRQKEMMEEDEDLQQKRLKALETLRKPPSPAVIETPAPVSIDLQKSPEPVAATSSSTVTTARNNHDIPKPERKEEPKQNNNIKTHETSLKTISSDGMGVSKKVKINRNRILSSCAVVVNQNVRRVNDDEVMGRVDINNHYERDTRVTISVDEDQNHQRKEDYEKYYREYQRQKREAEERLNREVTVKSRVIVTPRVPKIVTHVSPTHGSPEHHSHHPTGIQSKVVQPVGKRESSVLSSDTSASIHSSSRKRKSPSQSLSPAPPPVVMSSVRSVLTKANSGKMTPEPKPKTPELELHASETSDLNNDSQDEDHDDHPSGFNDEDDEEYETESESEHVGDVEVPFDDIQDDDLEDAALDDDEDDLLEPLNEPIPDLKSLKIQVKLGSGSRVVLSKPDAPKKPRLLRNNFP